MVKPIRGVATFDGFAHKRIQTSGTEIALEQGGNGPPLLLVHGYPQTHVMWHKVAPRLAQRFTVVAPDLRGYGASDQPPIDAEHLPIPSARWLSIWSR